MAGEGKHDLGLLLHRPHAVLLLLAQRCLPSVERPILEGAPEEISACGAARLRLQSRPGTDNQATVNYPQGSGQPWSRGGSWRQAQPAFPQRIWRSVMLPGSTLPERAILESSFAIAASCSCSECSVLTGAVWQLGRSFVLRKSRLAAFAESVGLQLGPEALLCEAVIERFILTGTGGLSPATVRTLATNLRALARALESHPQPAPLALPRERAKPPCSQAQIEGYPRLAAAQSTAGRWMRCEALICLGAGAGILAGELRGVRGSDVPCRSAACS